MVPEAVLGSPVIIVAAQQAPGPMLTIPCVAVVPPSEVLYHQSFLHAFSQQLIPGPLLAPRRPHCSIGILRQTVHPFHPVMSIAAVPMVTVAIVRRIDIVMPFQFAFVHVGTIGVWLIVRGGVSRDIIGSGPIVGMRGVVISTAVAVGHQIGHAARISIDFHLAVLPVLVRPGVQCAVRRCGWAWAGQAGV